MDEREARKQRPVMTEPVPPAGGPPAGDASAPFRPADDGYTHHPDDRHTHERLGTNEAPGDLSTADIAGQGHGTPAGANVLFTPERLEDLRERWTKVQTGFVDEPRRSVQDADHLVAETVKHLAEMFAAERRGLEGQWSRGDQVSTEDLRQILRRYRTFFDRLLSV